MRNLIWASLCCLAPIWVGCAGDDGLPRTVNASGTVYLDGAPIDGASVVVAESTGINFAQGFSDSSGRFSLNAFEAKKGAVPGSYKVTVSKTVTVEKAANQKQMKALAEDAQHAAEGGDATANASWVNDLPNKYASFATSGIEVTIPEDGTDQLKIELSIKK